MDGLGQSALPLVTDHMTTADAQLVRNPGWLLHGSSRRSSSAAGSSY